MIEADTSILDDAAETAEAAVRDALSSRYDVAAIFAETGSDRPKQVVRYITAIALYYLHQRLPDRMTPERIVKDYDDTIANLTAIEDGKKATTLPLLTAPEGEHGNTKFRWGSQLPRGQNY
jgi:phage gp36-like protein